MRDSRLNFVHIFFFRWNSAQITIFNFKHGLSRVCTQHNRINFNDQWIPMHIFCLILFLLALLPLPLTSFRRKKNYFAYKKPISLLFFFLWAREELEKLFNQFWCPKILRAFPNFARSKNISEFEWKTIKKAKNFQAKQEIFFTKCLLHFSTQLCQFLVFLNATSCANIQNPKKKEGKIFRQQRHEVYKKKERQSIQSKSLTLFQQDDSFVHFVCNEYIDRLFFMPLSLASAHCSLFFKEKGKKEGRKKIPGNFCIYFCCALSSSSKKKEM